MDSSVLARKAASGRQQEVLSPPWKSNEFHSLVRKDSWPVWLGSTQAPLSLGSSYLLVIFTEFPSVERKYLSIPSANYHFDLFFSTTKKQFWKETERPLIVFLPWKNHQRLCGEQHRGICHTTQKLKRHSFHDYSCPKLLSQLRDRGGSGGAIAQPLGSPLSHRVLL